MGYWGALQSDEARSAWVPVLLPDPVPENPAQVTALAFDETGLGVAVGNQYIGRSADGLEYERVALERPFSWLYDVFAYQAGRFWAVGTDGIIASEDGGRIWTIQDVPTEEELYAVSFWDGQTGMAVGAHGCALLTRDGGQTWEDVSTGLDLFWGDVVFLDELTALVVGEQGFVMRYRIDDK